MRTPPPNLHLGALGDALARGWSFRATALEYLPVGFGSHHWLAVDSEGTTRFVTVDVLTGAGGQADLDRLTAAFRTSYAIRHAAGIEQVVAPLPTPDGSPLLAIEPGFAVTVFEHLDAAPWPDEDEATPDDHRQIAELLAVVHATAASVATPALVDDLTIPHRAHLERRLTDRDEPWAGGPFAAPARTLLADHVGTVAEGLRAYDVAAERLVGGRASWVLTHGEPHSANLLRGPSGPLLIDWDTALVAPAGRDLWMLDPVGVGHYGALTARPVPADELDAYRLRWDLAEVAEYVRWFAEPHEANEDAEVAWGGLTEAMEHLAARAEPERRWSGGGGI